MISSRRNVPTKERALVLQGGGSLGAYEAGAYKALMYLELCSHVFISQSIAIYN
jgi:predicted acylesterase/phospholipase RssA